MTLPAAGAINPPSLPEPAFATPASVTMGGVPVAPVNITYMGEAPTLVSGVFQINVRIPAGLTGQVPIVVSIGGAPSQTNVTVAVR